MTKLTIGYELEFEGASLSDAHSLLRKFGHVGSDGSLRGGFELSSKVETFDKFRSYSNLDDDWDRLFEAVNSMPTESNGRTGMHVHVGRAGLGERETRIDIIKKINSLIISNRPLMELVGGRGENEYCAFADNSDAIIECDGSTGYKYRFLNVENDNTIEFRFFKVPKSLTRFLCNMQFIIAMCDFCIKDKQTVRDFRACNQKNKFIDFIKKGNYLDLNKFLAENTSHLSNGSTLTIQANRVNDRSLPVPDCDCRDCVAAIRRQTGIID